MRFPRLFWYISQNNYLFSLVVNVLMDLLLLTADALVLSPIVIAGGAECCKEMHSDIT